MQDRIAPIAELARNQQSSRDIKRARTEVTREFRAGLPWFNRKLQFFVPSVYTDSEDISPLRPGRDVSRLRTGITLALVTAGLYAGMFYAQPSSAINADSSNENAAATTDNLRRSIEKKQGVKIRTLREAYAETGVAYPETTIDRLSNRAFNEVPDQLNTEQLTVLDELLTALPAHFREPGEKGQPLELVASTHSCLCAAGEGKHDHQIQIDFKNLSDQRKAEGFDTLAHEIAHQKVPEFEPIEVTGGKTVVYARRSPWYNKIYQVFGTDFGQINRSMKDGVIALYGDYSDISTKYNIPPGLDIDLSLISDPNAKELTRFYARLSEVSTYTPDASELLAFMTERYTYGRIDFVTRFGQVFGQDKATALYDDLLKQDVFKGIEYPEHPIK